jgi:poly(hydroxyalkanoate) depolymerase family esterase
MSFLIEELKKATELTRQGKLGEATSAIQRALGGAGTETPAARESGRPEVAGVTDAEFREVPRTQPPVESPAAVPEPPAPGVRQEAAGPAAFDVHEFKAGGRTYAYRLFVPARKDDAPLPVIVMLHGCTQDAADFARGTAMNELAAQRGCIVVYPEQLARSNSMRCWNWFQRAHQQRGRGEPAMIAALATQVVQRCNGDASRVYVAGLSAGGAMATLVAQLYPDVFAAAGVHSGLPAASATDVRSAQAAMRSGPRKGSAAAAPGSLVPTIVFHGDADRTVHPRNGRAIVEEGAARATASGIALRRQEQRTTADGRPVTRVVYVDERDVTRLELWEIAAAAHAWSGGSGTGSYTEPSGPDASAAMLDFFLKHRLGGAAAN